MNDLSVSIIEGRRGLVGGRMWPAGNRGRNDRRPLRHPSDLIDEEWALIAPLIPPAKPGGNKRKRDMREAVNAPMSVPSTGCQWRVIPKDLPPRSTVYDRFDLRNHDGTLERIRHALHVACRERAGREAGPAVAIIDPQSVRARNRGAAIDPPGYDAGKKIKGGKRPVLVDTQGLLMLALVHRADIRDRDGGVSLMATPFGLHPLLLELYAEGGYRDPALQAGLRRVCRSVQVEIVERSEQAEAFELLPKRRIVGHTIARLNRCRRLPRIGSACRETRSPFSIRLIL